MNRRRAATIASFVLAIPLCAFALIAASPATTSAQIDGSADEARTLKVAELKLAALAKEAKVEAPATEAAAKKEPVAAKEPAKKQVHKARKKSRPVRVGAANGVAAKVPKITSRRLTSAEVQGILSSTRDFSGADLSGLSMVGMDLTGARFNRANLQRANLERADLAETDLELADLTGANLRGASLVQARLRGTRMDGARIEGALWTDHTVCKKGSVGSCIE